MSAIVDMTGIVVGRLTVLVRADGARWSCRCSCGALVTVPGKSLRSKRSPTRSCGCLIGEVTGSRNRARARHNQTESPTYRSWIEMRRRCTAEHRKEAARYAARGIRVCERWQTFENFYADMGQRPSGTSIDRIDNDGNYEPGNCRWATASEQAANRAPRKIHA